MLPSESRPHEASQHGSHKPEWQRQGLSLRTMYGHGPGCPEARSTGAHSLNKGWVARLGHLWSPSGSSREWGYMRACGAALLGDAVHQQTRAPGTSRRGRPREGWTGFQAVIRLCVGGAVTTVQVPRQNASPEDRALEPSQPQWLCLWYPSFRPLAGLRVPASIRPGVL